MTLTVMMWKDTLIFLLCDLVMTSAQRNSSAECVEDFVEGKITALEGESLRLPCPNDECSQDTDASAFSWYKENGAEKMGSSEQDRIHHHGALLLFLPVSLNDSGLYHTRWQYGEGEEECVTFVVELKVFKAFHPDLLYQDREVQELNPIIYCPDSAAQMCTDGQITWYKDFHLIPDESDVKLIIQNACKQDEGIYTCMCTWRHNRTFYNTTASQTLVLKAVSVRHPPIIQHPANGSTEITELDAVKELTCTVFFGINIAHYENRVFWERKGQKLRKLDGYTENVTREGNTYRSILTISRVTAADLQAEFQCIAVSSSSWSQFVTVTLKTSRSMLTSLLVCVCVIVVFLLAMAAVRWFAVDLALCFRGIFIRTHRREDGKVYDAYVIHQKHGLDAEAEERVGSFVSTVLPGVLESRCGLKLFIHGRDDLPGEDRMELIETRMRLSRRLMVVLAPAGGLKVATPEGFDWQVGLHQALVQGEMSVILVQLGEGCEGGYTHLPLGLQHLLRKSSPLRWEEGGRGAASPRSRFWKSVRYMMPMPRMQRATSTSASTCGI